MTEQYVAITPFRQYEGTRAWEDYTIDLPLWKVRLNERLDALLIAAFVESSLSEAIMAQRYREDFSANTFTIEGTLLLLQNYLGFVFPDPTPVINYLVRHRNLFDVVLLACVLTEEKFSQNSQISLELYSDPDIDDKYLTIYVRQKSYEPDIIKKIDLISQQYIDVMDIDQGYLLITTDFQPPRE
jgi:hypothetical protein